MTNLIEQNKQKQVRFLRLPEVMARTGLSRSTIYVRLDEERFPRSGLAGCPRRRLDRGRGGGVDARADRGEPRRRGVMASPHFRRMTPAPLPRRGQPSICDAEGSPNPRGR